MGKGSKHKKPIQKKKAPAIRASGARERRLVAKARSEGCDDNQILGRLHQSRMALARARTMSVQDAVTLDSRKSRAYDSRNRSADVEVNDRVSGYVSQLLAPSVSPAVRPPVPNAMPHTGLYKSRQVVELTTNAQGRFAAIVQPTIGASADPATYRVANVASTVADYNAADWSDATSYDQSSATLFDQDYYAVQSAVDAAIFRINPAVADANATDLLGSASTVLDLNGNTVSYDDIRYKSGQGTSGLEGRFFLYAGEALDLSIVTGTAATAWNAKAGDAALVYTDEGLTIPMAAANYSFLSKQSTGTTSRADNALAFIITVQEDAYVVVDLNSWPGQSTASRIVYSRSTTGAAPLEDAVITTLRPVAMSCLTKCTASATNNGGDIAATYLPGNQQDEWFSQSGKNYQDWGVVAALPESYSGALKDGSYQWWSLDDPSDASLKTPSEHLQQKFACFAVAGQLAAGTAGTVADIHVATLIIDRIFEYTTVSRMFDTEVSDMTQSELNAACDLIRIAQIPHSMENDGHGNFISRAIEYIDSGGMQRTVENLRHVASEVKALVFSVV